MLASAAVAGKRVSPARLLGNDKSIGRILHFGAAAPFGGAGIPFVGRAKQHERA
jgi:hypothetical protein